MDLVRGETAMEFWEISPEELAGIAVVFQVPCISRDTYEEVSPPTTLAMEVVLDEFAYRYKMSSKLMESGCFREYNLNTSQSITYTEEHERIRIGLKKKENRSKEVEEVKNLLFDKFILYSLIQNVKISGSIITCFMIKNKKDKNKNEDIAEIKNNMFFLAGYQTQMFDDLKATLGAVPKIDEITKEFKKITSSATKKKDETPVRGISGSTIIRRWSGSSLDIKAALREESLIPVNKLPGDSADCGPRRTKLMDPCLYCEDGPVGGKCEHLPADDYCPGRTPEDQLFRINNEIFLMDEVESYEESMGFRHNNGQLRFHQQPEGTKPTTPFEYVELWRSQGVRDHKELASRIDGVFTGDHKLSNPELGRLLPANPGCEITPRAQADRGKRLRGLKK
jgi:hypothetical protein